MSKSTVPQTPAIARLHTTPASLAAALRSAADQLAAMGHVEISPVALQLNIQAVSYRGTSEERIATVDALSLALAGTLAVNDGRDNPHHSLPFEARETRGDCELAIYTVVRDAGSAS